MIEYDLVVVGGGIAGLRAAIAAAEAQLNVAIVSRTALAQSPDGNLRDGINAPSGDDQMAAFIADSTAAGAGLAQPQQIESAGSAAAAVVVELEHMGTAFARSDDAGLAQIKLANNSVAYTVAAGWWSGRAVLNALIDRVAAYSIDVFTEWVPLDLHTDESGICGLTAYNIRSGLAQGFASGNVLLTDGSLGGLFAVSDNLGFAVGTSQALALTAGSQLADMEMIEWAAGIDHPSDSVKGAAIGGALAMAGRGITGLDAAPGLTHGSLALAIEESSSPAADFSPFADEIELVAPEIAALLGDGLKSPLVPSVHFALGGVNPCTGVDGLYVAGEAAASPLLGGGLLPGNAILDLVDSAKSVANGIAPRPANLPESARIDAQARLQLAFRGDDSVDPGALFGRLRAVMSDFVGLSRSADGLGEAALLVAEISDSAARAAPAWNGSHYNLELVRLIELRRAAITASAVIAGAQSRTESRGCHRRSDHPEGDDQEAMHIVLRQQGAAVVTDQTASLSPQEAGVAA